MDRKSHHAVAACLVLLVASVAPAATAQSVPATASASLTNFQITLVDLQPDDGIAPSWSFVGEPLTSSGAQAYPVVPIANFPEVVTDRFFDPTAVGLSGAWGHVGVMPQPNGVVAAISLSQRAVSTSAFMFTSASLVLGPQTSLHITGIQDVALDCRPDAVCVEGIAETHFTTFSSVWGATSRTGDRQLSTVDLRLTRDVLDNGVLDDASASIDVSIDNPLSFEQQYRIDAWTHSALLTEGLLPVPEPGTAGLLAAGLGILCWTRRRSLAQA